MLPLASVDIVTPVIPSELHALLQGYDVEKVNYLVDGFLHGFHLHCQIQPDDFKTSCKNLTSCFDYPEAVNEKIRKELNSGRLSGPFSQPPFEQFHISPIGIVEKKTPGKFRLIHHLSSPKGFSVNDSIPDAERKVEYSSIQDAISCIKKQKTNSFLAKCDIESAFRIIPIHPDDRHVLGFHWQSQFYFDKCLPMGLSESCKIFEEFSSAIEWAITHKLGASGVVHVLDDFLFIEPNKLSCDRILSDFQNMCKMIGLPLAPDKTFGPEQILPFLGITLDTIKFEARLPPDKVSHCKELTQIFKTRKKVTLKELQSLVGTLQFATSVVCPGRPFLRRLIDLTIGVQKPFFKIRLTNESRADLQTWYTFLTSFNGKSFFLDEKWVYSDSLHFFTDACTTIGYGAIFGDQWFSGEWLPSVKQLGLPISVLEFYPIVVAVVTWGDLLQNKCVSFFTDNQALVPVINKQTAKNKMLMRLLRILVLFCLKHNILFKAFHVPGCQNDKADALSRLQVDKFKTLHPTASIAPTVVPETMAQDLFLRP